MEGGFGFGFRPQNSYEIDTSRLKDQVINILKKSETLWNSEGKQEESLVQLRKGISVLELMVQNESIESVKNQYSEKLIELNTRLKNRREGKQVAQNMDMYSVTYKPNVKWEDVSGLDEVKQVLIYNFPEIFTGSRMPLKGILLYGPPGTGKTFLAKACANEAEASFYFVKGSDLMSEYIGHSEQLIKSLFNSASEKKPALICIDELDTLFDKKFEENQNWRRAKTEFIIKMHCGYTGVQILATTSRPWALDPVVRKMFQRRIYISLPEFQARLDMIKKGLKSNENDLKEEDYQEFAKHTENYSGSDITTLVRDAVSQPMRRIQAAKKFKKLQNGRWSPCQQGEEGQGGNWQDFNKTDLEIGKISKEDFVSAITRSKPSVDLTQLKQYEEFTQNFGI